ncbi:MAG TPA: nuclease-related domain-containing protein [Phycisphaerae bacterium]|nr:nuclease-related domain-containing protein [Phycisphaerae bacterium]HNU45964.1 nuclease-related domain-containing protein [Phycisphaerae bacterium]
MKQTKDPIKEEPLPQAGESTQTELLRAVLESLLLWFVVVVFLVYITLYQWYAWWLQKPIHPGVMTGLTVIALIIAAVRFPAAYRRARNLRLGHRGEVAVGQCLEHLRTKGYKVYHDIGEKGYNIDHVLIGPAGVVVIETKTISKPARGDARVTYDGQHVTVDGHTPDRDPVAQAQAGASRMAEVLTEALGRRPPVRPVVLYPGWFVDPQPRGADVWVLNPKALPSFLDQEPRVLSVDDIRRLSSELERHMRRAPR